jgi:hypothetical protein
VNAYWVKRGLCCTDARDSLMLHYVFSRHMTLDYERRRDALWLPWTLFFGFLAWLLGYLVLKSPLLSLIPAVLTPVIAMFLSSIVSVTINNMYSGIIFAIFAILLMIAFFLKPGVAKIVLSTLSIPVVVIDGVGLVVVAYLRMIP